MTFFQRAREAAQQAAEQARQAAERTTSPEGQAAVREGLSGAHAQARQAASQAGRLVRGAVERIDADSLADLIIKATALQEAVNTALTAKESPYRIGAVTIAATIPPGVSFTIQRAVEGRHSSTELARALDPAGIVSLTGEDGEAVAARPAVIEGAAGLAAEAPAGPASGSARG